MMSSNPATADWRSDSDGAATAAAAEEEGSEEWEVLICHDGHLVVVLYVDSLLRPTCAAKYEGLEDKKRNKETKRGKKKPVMLRD